MIRTGRGKASSETMALTRRKRSCDPEKLIEGGVFKDVTYTSVNIISYLPAAGRLRAFFLPGREGIRKLKAPKSCDNEGVKKEKAGLTEYPNIPRCIILRQLRRVSYPWIYSEKVYVF